MHCLWKNDCLSPMPPFIIDFIGKSLHQYLATNLFLSPKKVDFCDRRKMEVEVDCNIFYVSDLRALAKDCGLWGYSKSRKLI